MLPRGLCASLSGTPSRSIWIFTRRQPLSAPLRPSVLPLLLLSQPLRPSVLPLLLLSQLLRPTAPLLLLSQSLRPTAPLLLLSQSLRPTAPLLLLSQSLRPTAPLLVLSQPLRPTAPLLVLSQPLRLGPRPLPSAPQLRKPRSYSFSAVDSPAAAATRKATSHGSGLSMSRAIQWSRSTTGLDSKESGTG